MSETIDISTMTRRQAVQLVADHLPEWVATTPKCASIMARLSPRTIDGTCNMRVADAAIQKARKAGTIRVADGNVWVRS